MKKRRKRRFPLDINDSRLVDKKTSDSPVDFMIFTRAYRTTHSSSCISSSSSSFLHITFKCRRNARTAHLTFFFAMPHEFRAKESNYRRPLKLLGVSSRIKYQRYTLVQIHIFHPKSQAKRCGAKIQTCSLLKEKF